MEVEWTAGPIPWADQLGKEVVVSHEAFTLSCCHSYCYAEDTCACRGWLHVVSVFMLCCWSSGEEQDEAL